MTDILRINQHQPHTGKFLFPRVRLFKTTTPKPVFFTLHGSRNIHLALSGVEKQLFCRIWRLIQTHSSDVMDIVFHNGKTSAHRRASAVKSNVRQRTVRAISTFAALATLVVGLPTAASAAASSACDSKSLSSGSRGTCVAVAQRYLGVRPDGSFGPATRAAAIAWQRSHGISPTGNIGPKTWASFVGKATTIASTVTAAPNTIPGPCAKYAATAVVCASQGQKKLWLIKGNNIVMTFDARFGSRSHPTRNGTFSVGWKAAKYWSKTYNSSMPYSLFYDGGRAIHFSGAFANGDLGPSHGCIRLRTYSGAAALFNAVPVGTRVVVF